MLDRILLPSVERLKKLINEEYLSSGNVILLVQPGEDDFNLMDLNAVSFLEILENLINKIVNNANASELTDESIEWIEKVLETDVITFKRYSKRLVVLQELARKYPDEYEETLIKHYTNLAIKIVNSYLNCLLTFVAISLDWFLSKSY